VADCRFELFEEQEAVTRMDFVRKAAGVSARHSPGGNGPAVRSPITELVAQTHSLREAVRVLESERRVEVGRGAHTVARICVPGLESVTRPFGLLLKLSGATIGDVTVARTAIEPLSARYLAESGNHRAYDELEHMVENDLPAAYESGNLAEISARFHRRIVELSGNATFGMIAGMLHEIAEKHTAVAIRLKRGVPVADYDNAIRSYRRLIELLRAGDGEKTEAHWRRHMENSRAWTLEGLESVEVGDIID